MIDPSTPFRIRSDVRYRIIDQEAVVIQQEDAKVLSLNETGTYILAALDGNRTVSDLLAAMVDEYEVEPATLETDVLAYLEQLLAAHVIEPAPRAPD